MAGIDVTEAAAAVATLASAMRAAGVAFATFSAGPVASLSLGPDPAGVDAIETKDEPAMTPEELAALDELRLYASAGG